MHVSIVPATAPATKAFEDEGMLRRRVLETHGDQEGGAHPSHDAARTAAPRPVAFEGSLHDLVGWGGHTACVAHESTWPT